MSFIAIRKIPVVILNILTLIGLFYMFKKDKTQALIIVLVLLSFTLVYGVTTNANIRYKLDIEWLQLIPASYFLLKIIKPLKT
jgi:heme O synthase-like polyprenyltransferase